MAKPATKPLAGRHLRRLAAQEAAPANHAARGVAGLLHRQIRADPQNPRKSFEEEGLEELEASIVRDGLVEPLAVRPVPGETTADGLQAYMLIAGERRWQAIGRAIENGSWPKDQAIESTIKLVDEPTARRLALVENLQRRDLKPLEEARALQGLAELTGASAAQIGRDLGFTERWAQQRLALLKLPEALQAQIEAGELTVEDARQAPGLLAKLPEIKRVELSQGKISVEEAASWLAAQPKPLNLTSDEWLLALEVYDKVKRAPIGDDYHQKSMTECGSDARFDERIKPLSIWPNYLLQHVSHVMDDGGETGRFQVGVGHDGARQLRIKFGDVEDAGVRLRALDSLYAERGEVRTPPAYSTAWLNGPFEIHEALAAEIAEARQTRAADQARWATQSAQQRADAAARLRAAKEREQALADAAPRARELMSDLEPATRDEAVHILHIAHPLPWIWKVEDPDTPYPVSGIQDADGDWVTLEDNDGVGAMIILAIVNGFAGHATKVVVEPDEATEDDAEPISPDVNDQVDLEDALAADDEDLELTPALKRLAGVTDAAEVQ